LLEGDCQGQSDRQDVRVRGSSHRPLVGGQAEVRCRLAILGRDHRPWAQHRPIQSTSLKCSQVGAVSLVDPRDPGQVDGHEPSARHREQCRTAEHPEPTTLAEARGGRIDHGLDQLGEMRRLGHVAGRIDDDVVTDHRPGQVRRFIHAAANHAQVRRARELDLISHHRRDLVRARKYLSENALAGIAGGAEEKDFHNRTSRMAHEL
jgi:hypothetical protein